MKSLVYKEVFSSVKPELFEINTSTVYFRKNIVEIELILYPEDNLDENGKPLSNTPVKTGIYSYKYEEATLPLDEFGQYVNEVLLFGQENSTNNQLAIMEAFADLYEAIAFNL